jgi:hypothetical protein
MPIQGLKSAGLGNVVGLGARYAAKQRNGDSEPRLTQLIDRALK